MLFQFTDQAQKAMLLANDEAIRIHYEYVATEHILLGLMRETDGLASKVLHHLGLELLDIREEAMRIVGFGPEQPVEGRLTLSPRAKAVLRYAAEESQNLQHTHVGTIELLLGMLREEEGVAAEVLQNLGVNLDRLKTRILNLRAQGLDEDTVSKETFDSLVDPDENEDRVPDRQKRMQRPKITVSVIPVKTAQVAGFSMVRAAQLAEQWHREFVAKFGHPWSNDWDEQIARSLQGKNGRVLHPRINKKWYPWWKQLLLKLSTDGIFESPDCPEKWLIRE